MSLAKASPSSIPLNVGQHVCAVLRFFSKSMPKNLIQKAMEIFFSFLKLLFWKGILQLGC